MLTIYDIYFNIYNNLQWSNFNNLIKYKKFIYKNSIKNI
jgi:hypothetical protein